MSSDNIILKRDGKVAVVTLNRPEKLNAVNLEMMRKLIEVFGELARDDSVAVMVLTGAGRAFSSGLDMGQMAAIAGLEGPALDAEQIRQVFHTTPRVISLLLEDMQKPTIAMVNGVAIAVSCDLTLACDMRTGSPNARFMQTQVTLGLIPGGGGTWILPRLVGYGKAMEMILTGDPVDGQEAYRLGILDELYPEDKLEEKTMELAQKIAGKPATALRLAKLNVRRGLTMDLESALALVAASEGLAAASSDYRQAFGEVWKRRTR
ncbi:MAG: enoyl-CoA hydratase/isomerase family protein [Chloroflexota bacterium]